MQQKCREKSIHLVGTNRSQDGGKGSGGGGCGGSGVCVCWWGGRGVGGAGVRVPRLDLGIRNADPFATEAAQLTHSRLPYYCGTLAAVLHADGDVVERNGSPT